MMNERVWAIADKLPFETYPRRLIIEMVNNVIFWSNHTPQKDRIHDIMSPQTILMGLRIKHNKHCKLVFG